MPRRRVGVLLPLEEVVLEIGLRRLREGEPEFHGFALAAELDSSGGRQLTAHGTLYKALDRLEQGGLLVSRWEDPAEHAGSRPRRRLYRVSDEAGHALQVSRMATRRVAVPKPGWATP
jgi:PadR family transcriptional regulator